MNTKNHDEPKLGKTIWSDIRRGDFRRTLKRDWRELKEFYLDKDHQERLLEMKRLKRWFFMFVWMLKILFLKLTPVRRILLLLGVFFIFFSGKFQISAGQVQYQNDTNILGFLIIVFILMLELKDKLLARDELMAGRAVQNALMPVSFPPISGWSLWLFTHPANEVGGDLVDFLEIDNQRYGVALGDVSGKGLAAALFMAKLQATLRAVAPDLSSLAELGAKLNKIFYRDGLPNSFASLIYLEFRPDSNDIRLLNAGHMPPVHIKNGGIEEMRKGNNALGLSPSAKYAEHHLSLQKGEILLAYSDGLTEARNEAGVFFGEKRLKDLIYRSRELSARKFGEKILTEISAFVGDARPHDDLSLVILKRID
ncbi:MAG: PP2C family protein-serine/threonine phosphatase [Calditrichia bacterium]